MLVFIANLINFCTIIVVLYNQLLFQFKSAVILITLLHTGNRIVNSINFRATTNPSNLLISALIKTICCFEA